MTWVEVFVVFVVCHLAGDFLLQTHWQAVNKHGGLGRDPIRRRALLTHVGCYALPFLPALAWVASDGDADRSVAAFALVLGTHLVQDDGRLMVAYLRAVKHTEAAFGSALWIAVDQSLHVLVLFAAALIAAA